MIPPGGGGFGPLRIGYFLWVLWWAETFHPSSALDLAVIVVPHSGQVHEESAISVTSWLVFRTREA